MRTICLVLCAAAACVYASMLEETILENYGDLIFRPDSTTLCIVTDAGDTVIFRNSEDVESALDYADYRAVDYNRDLNYWVVEMGGYEWIEWRVVDGETGAVDTTISIPVPSPDGSWLLCFKEDITAGFLLNGIQIWGRGPDGLVLEFEDVDVPWGPVEARWQDDSTVVFQKMTYDYDTWEMQTRPGSLTLSADGVWSPDDPLDWDWPE
jgi:hypothetical protein